MKLSEKELIENEKFLSKMDEYPNFEKLEKNHIKTILKTNIDENFSDLLTMVHSVLYENNMRISINLYGQEITSEFNVKQIHIQITNDIIFDDEIELFEELNNCRDDLSKIKNPRIQCVVMGFDNLNDININLLRCYIEACRRMIEENLATPELLRLKI